MIRPGHQVNHTDTQSGECVCLRLRVCQGVSFKYKLVITKGLKNVFDYFVEVEPRHEIQLNVDVRKYYY